jgi:hypothetical protein
MILVSSRIESTFSMKHLLFLLLLLPLTVLGQDKNAYTSFEIGSTQYLLGNDVNVRKTPASSGAVQTKLPIATEVKIMAEEGSFAMNGFSAPWYKVEYKNTQGKAEQGYVWGGLIAAGSAKSKTDPDLRFLYGLNKIQEEDEGATTTGLQLRAAKYNKELAKIEFFGLGAVSTYSKLEVAPPQGLTGVKDILDVDFSDQFCGGAFGKVYLFWDGTKFHYAIGIRDFIDAPMVYTETLLFPSDEGGIKGKVRFVAESNAKVAESEDPNVDLNQKEVVEEHIYLWTGSELKIEN